MKGLTTKVIHGPVRVWLMSKGSKTQELHKNT